MAVDRVPQVDQRQLRPENAERGAVERLPRPRRRGLASVVEQEVYPPGSPPQVVQRALRVDELVDVAVRVDASRPANLERVVVALILPAERGHELGRLQVDLESR